MTLSIIVAAADNDVIGRAGRLPWRLPADLERFKALTWGKTIIMGARTHASIGRPLPGRENVVLSRRRDWQPRGCSLRGNWQAVVREYARGAECMVIGGAALYRLALPAADTLYLTRVHTRAAGDVFLPRVDWRQWRECVRLRHRADVRNEYDYSFVVLRRR